MPAAPIATDARGDSLIEIVRTDSAGLSEASARTPCPLALVVVADGHSGRVLFGLNWWRRSFELPGGMVEDDESFESAASRELQEETGINVPQPLLVGYAYFGLTTPPREELGAIFFARVFDAVATPSDELVELAWRVPLTASDTPVSHLDDVIAAWALTVVAG
ncbi:NUDIX domain-containing protein [Paramicrobacterium fandaimingii]|uniref:NUDIX domain-containing protein n=1 Tax=Paramicrobacterium fandaimingii TaxID=2708079 RepID=UPI0014204FE7|nr:NUDIX domain-containing protein [Microbacterium fandaimingii]